MLRLTVIFEDNQVIVVKKIPGILSQADITGELDMLTLIKNYLKNKYNKQGNVFLGLLHRLDKNVGGIMVFAKTSKAASRISEQIRDHKFKKYYLAVVEGKFNQREGVIKNYLIKDPRTKQVKVVGPQKGAKEAELLYKVIDYSNGMSLIAVDLKTGRTHQIRAQLSNLGHPIVGDVKYGSNERLKSISLWANEISFHHPVSKKELNFVLNPPKEYPWSRFGGLQNSRVVV